MFQGTVEDAESYHLKRGIAVNYKRDISWKAWSFKNIEDIGEEDLKFQYCSSAKYAGDGYLFNKIGSRKYYVLSEWPNHAAVRMMINGDRTVQNQARKCDKCHKTFRSTGDLQITMCGSCL